MTSELATAGPASRETPATSGHDDDTTAAVVLPPVRRTVAVVAVLMAMLMVNIDSSIVNVALPQLSRDLHATPADTVWVTTAFLLAVASSLPAAAGLATRLGRKRMFTIGVPLFTLASLACALSPTLEVLIAARVAQGLTASLLFAVAIPIYRHLFPPRRLGMVLGLNAMVVALGISVGPTLGGLILGGLSWPWLFLINVPLGVISTVLALITLPHRPTPHAPLDIGGMLVGGAATASFLLGVHQFEDPSRVWLGAVIIAASAVLVALFIRIERRSSAPVLPIQMFTGRFNLAVITAFWSFFGQGVAFVALPFLFQTAYHATPLQSALLFTPWPIVIVIVAPISGRLADRWSSARLAVIGLAVYTGGLASLALLGGHPPVWQVLTSTAVTGLGFAIFQAPNNRDMMGAAPLSFAGPAALTLNTGRTLAQSAGAGAVSMALALSGASALSAAAEASAANAVLYVAVAGAGAAVVVSIVKLRTMTAARRSS